MTQAEKQSVKKDGQGEKLNHSQHRRPLKDEDQDLKGLTSKGEVATFLLSRPLQLGQSVFIVLVAQKSRVTFLDEGFTGGLEQQQDTLLLCGSAKKKKKIQNTFSYFHLFTVHIHIYILLQIHNSSVASQQIIPLSVPSHETQMIVLKMMAMEVCKRSLTYNYQTRKIK